MSETESNAEFLVRMDNLIENLNGHDRARLLALAERGAKIPDGPTKAMCQAGVDTLAKWDGELLPMGLAYRAMIAAALKDSTNG